MLRSASLLALGLSLAACSGSTYTPPDPDTCAVDLWDPNSGRIDTWPTMQYLVVDETRRTGYRFDIQYERYEDQLFGYFDFALVATRDLSELDGFGNNGGGFFTFSQPIDESRLRAFDATIQPSDPVGILVLDGDDSRLEAARLQVRGNDDELLVVEPVRPLPPGATVAYFVTDRLAPATGGCIARSVADDEAIRARREGRREAIDALEALGVIENRRELIALHVVPVQSTALDSQIIARSIAARPESEFLPNEAFTCEDDEARGWRYCQATLPMRDYRDEDRVVRTPGDIAPEGTPWDVPIHAWFPLEGEGPFPTLLVGHGLNGEATSHPRDAAELAIPNGFAVVAISAVHHGLHPTTGGMPPDGLDTVFDLFAIDIATPSVKPLELRDNFRQSTYDKLHATRFLQTSPDLDGDGQADIDGANLGYLGLSLGALQGPELLALSDAFSSTVLAMPGGRVIRIVTDDAGLFGALISIILPGDLQFDDAERAKAFLIVQTTIDGGDPATFGANVIEDRFDFAPEPPHVLLAVVLDDEVVVNSSSYGLATAMGVPIAPEVLRPVPGLASLPEGDVSGNGPGGLTIGLQQYDVEERGGEIVQTEHDRMPRSDLAEHSFFGFFETAIDGATPIISDPYAALGIPHGIPE